MSFSLSALNICRSRTSVHKKSPQQNTANLSSRQVGWAQIPEFSVSDLLNLDKFVSWVGNVTLSIGKRK